MKVKNLLFLFVVVFMLSCAKVIDLSSHKLDRNKTYAVIPFENYTDTPLAGYRVASIVEGVLMSKGYVVNRVWEYRDTEPTQKELSELLQKARASADYVIYGTVNEFRYKTGIDGEPAVSISLYVLESSTGKVVAGSTLSGSGWAHQSLGTLTQKLIRESIK